MNQTTLFMDGQCSAMTTYIQLQGGHKAFPITDYSNPPLEVDDLPETGLKGWMEDIILDTFQRDAHFKHVGVAAVTRNGLAAIPMTQDAKYRTKSNKIKKRVKTPHVNKANTKFKDALLAETQAMNQPFGG